MNEPPKILSERWHLAALPREDLVKAALWALIVGLMFALFHFQGNTTDTRAFGRSAILWMIERWSDDTTTGSDYSHGWLIPVAALAAVWMKRGELARAPREVSRIGLSVVILGLLIHWLGAKAQQTRFSLGGLVILIWGLPYYFCGWQVARLLIFPCAYLIFCIPLNFLDSITFPLRLFAASVSTALLNGLGLAAERSGSAIYSTVAGGFSFDVADPCSGIRSLVAMAALTSFYAHLTQRTLLRKWLLFLSAIPLAIVGNIARITSVALTAEAFGEEIAMRIVHDYSGYIVFGVGILLMIGIAELMNANIGEIRQRWKHALLSPTSP
jgi:exosortase